MLVKVFKNVPSKIFERLPFTNFTWSILEYFVPCPHDGVYTKEDHRKFNPSLPNVPFDSSENFRKPLVPLMCSGNSKESNRKKGVIMGCLRLVGRQGFFQLFKCFKDNFESLRWRRPHSTAVHQSMRVA